MNITWSHNPEDHDINFHPYKNLKSYESEWRVIEFNCKPQNVRKFIIHGKEHIKLQTYVKCYKELHSLKLLISHVNYFIHSMTWKWKHSSRTCKQDYKANDTSKTSRTSQYVKYHISHKKHASQENSTRFSQWHIIHSLDFNHCPIFTPNLPQKKRSWKGTIPIL